MKHSKKEFFGASKMLFSRRGDIEFGTIVRIIIVVVVLLTLIGIVLFFKDMLWDKFGFIKEGLRLG